MKQKGRPQKKIDQLDLDILNALGTTKLSVSELKEKVGCTFSILKRRLEDLEKEEAVRKEKTYGGTTLVFIPNSNEIKFNLDFGIKEFIEWAKEKKRKSK